MENEKKIDQEEISAEGLYKTLKQLLQSDQVKDKFEGEGWLHQLVRRIPWIKGRCLESNLSNGSVLRIVELGEAVLVSRCLRSENNPEALYPETMYKVVNKPIGLFKYDKGAVKDNGVISSRGDYVQFEGEDQRKNLAQIKVWLKDTKLV